MPNTQVGGLIDAKLLKDSDAGEELRELSICHTRVEFKSAQTKGMFTSLQKFGCLRSQLVNESLGCFRPELQDVDHGEGCWVPFECSLPFSL